MNRVILWGSEGGIGRALLTEFKDQGWEAAAVAREITSVSTRADWTFEADFRRAGEVDEVAGALRGLNLGFQVYIFAGGDIASLPVGKADPADWQRILDNNLTAAYQTLRASLPLLAEDAGIFLMGAVSERLQLPGLSAYAAAKAGLEALAVSVAKEERRKRITVVRPGAVDTDLWEKVPFNKPAHTFPPEKVAARVWEAYQEGSQGQLDLV